MKDIPGYEGLYAVTTDGKVWSHISSIWLALQSSDAAGHLTVVLRSKGKGKTWGVHQLVILTYVGPCPVGMEVCHNNNRGGDNRLENLRYGTHRANMVESAQQNADKIARGERINTAKLNPSKIREIRRLYAQGTIRAGLARMYGVTETAIAGIVSRKTWKHVED